AEEHEADEPDRGAGREHVAHGAEGDRRRRVHGIAIDAGRDAGEGYALEPVARGEREARPGAAGARLGPALTGVAGDGAGRVDDVAARKAPGGRDHGLARGQRALPCADGLALLEDRRTAAAVYGSVHTAAAHQARVRGVHDRVDRFPRDVAADELEAA